mmetsp:Transcript_28388/g.45802  ORF Transcript_28388/g.45802 Transcript_28388/m.45802 type:complete len:313 (-) Transcript_28388:465-1403(-)
MRSWAPLRRVRGSRLTLFWGTSAAIGATFKFVLFTFGPSRRAASLGSCLGTSSTWFLHLPLKAKSHPTPVVQFAAQTFHAFPWRTWRARAATGHIHEPGGGINIQCCIIPFADGRYRLLGVVDGQLGHGPGLLLVSKHLQEWPRPEGDVLLLLTYEESAERFTFTLQRLVVIGQLFMGTFHLLAQALVAPRVAFQLPAEVGGLRARWVHGELLRGPPGRARVAGRRHHRDRGRTRRGACRRGALSSWAHGDVLTLSLAVDGFAVRGHSQGREARTSMLEQRAHTEDQRYSTARSEVFPETFIQHTLPSLRLV